MCRKSLEKTDTAKAPKQPVPQDDRRDLVAAVEWITSSGVATGGTDLVLIASTLRVGSWPSLSRQGRPEKYSLVGDDLRTDLHRHAK